MSSTGVDDRGSARLALAAGLVLATLAAAACSARGESKGDVGPATPAGARDGSYRYVVTNTRMAPVGDTEKRSSRVSTRMRTTSRASGDVRQTVMTGKDKAEVAWRPDGQYLISDNYEELPEQCRWEPPILNYPTPVRAGATWTVDSTCASGPITVHRTEEARVTGRKHVKVGGVGVDVWVVERTGTTSYGTDENGGRSLELDTTATHLFSQRHRLAVRSTVITATTTVGGATLEASTDRELKDLRPH